MLPHLEVHPEGVVLSVKARPGARANALRGVHDGALRMQVTQVAEKGKANGALVGLLAAELGLSRTQVELLSGARSSQKRFLLRDCQLEAVRARLAALLAADS